MGREARCTARCGGESGEGLALLETGELVFRGALRFRVPLARVSALAVEGGTLRLSFDGKTAELDLGPQAAAWAERIRSPKTRAEKLGVPAGARVALVGAFDAAFRAEIAGRGATLATRGDGLDAIFFAVARRADLARLPRLRVRLAPAGALWLVRPRGSAEVSERATMAAAKAAGLVDVKVVRFSEAHTADKYVIPVAQRPRSPATVFAMSRKRKRKR